MIERIKQTRYKGLKITVLLIFITAGFAYSVYEPGSKNSLELDNIPVFKVKKGPLTISVVESGTVRPRDQIILRNETEEASTILSIVKEGKRVKEGDLLVELDVTQQERRYQTGQLDLQNDKAEYISSRETLEIVKNQAEADIQQAELTLKFAKQDLQKYIEGDYPKQLKEAEAAITIAEEEYSQAKEALSWSKVLYEEKYLSQTVLQQDELAAKKAKLNVELANEDLELLKNFTHERQLEQLKSDVQQAQMALERARLSASASITDASARYLSRQERYEDEINDLQELKEEIERAKISAPMDGIALYASSVLDNWDDSDDRIRVGASVPERREIIFLTAAEEYNVDIQIQETDLNKIDPGLPATLKIDALPNETFRGTVKNVSPLPDQYQRHLNPNLKVYKTDIAIEGDTQHLRNGMSCRAEIIVEEYEDVTYIPIQAVVKINDQTSVYVKNDNQLEVRPVSIGLDNSRMIHITEGLSEGEYVLLKPPLNMEEQEPLVEEEEKPNPQLAQTQG